MVAVVAYGQVLPPVILELPRFGCINPTPRMLRRPRGRPDPWALAERRISKPCDDLKINAGLDTGDILHRRPRPFLRTTTADAPSTLAGLGAKLLVKTILILSPATSRPVRSLVEGVQYAAN